jgi:hypothetical protein
MENMAAVCPNNLLRGWVSGLDADRAVFLVGGKTCRSNVRSEVLLQRLCGFPLEILHFWSGLVSLGYVGRPYCVLVAMWYNTHLWKIWKFCGFLRALDILPVVGESLIQ